MNTNGEITVAGVLRDALVARRINVTMGEVEKALQHARRHVPDEGNWFVRYGSDLTHSRTAELFGYGSAYCHVWVSMEALVEIGMERALPALRERLAMIIAAHDIAKSKGLRGYALTSDQRVALCDPLPGKEHPIHALLPRFLFPSTPSADPR
jgi:hypothetical protein